VLLFENLGIGFGRKCHGLWRFALSGKDARPSKERIHRAAASQESKSRMSELQISKACLETVKIV
jgi:hypothetical protein